MRGRGARCPFVWLMLAHRPYCMVLYLGACSQTLIKKGNLKKMKKYRDKKINFRLLEDEYVYIKSLQKESGLNLSQYIIRCCMNKKIKKINGLKETLYELNKIGNNLNQLTRKVHQSQSKEAQFGKS